MSMMKKAALVAALGLAANAAVADTTVRARAGYVFGDYELSQDFEGSYTADYDGLPLGLTVSFDGGMYVDLLLVNVDGDATVWGETTSFERDDTTVTLGWRTGEGSLYIGYKTAETTTGFPFGLPDDVFESSGLLLGGGLVFPNGSHVFGLSGGIGFMEGTYSPDPSESYDADYTVGYSFGLSYTYVVSAQFNVTADYKWQSYDFEFSDYDTTLTEEFSAFGVTVGYTF